MTDQEFRLAMTEVCRRFDEAVNNWASFKPRMSPPRARLIDYTEEKNRRAWMEHQRDEIWRTACGLLNCMPGIDMNKEILRRLPRLLWAARRKAKEENARPKGIPRPWHRRSTRRAKAAKEARSR